MEYFKGAKTQIAPCISSKARFALGIAHKEPSNNKTCSYNYWSKVIDTLATEKSVSSEVAEEAKEKFSHIIVKKLLLVIVFFGLCCTSSAQANDIVTLTVSGRGESVEIATQNALRSAVERAFGTFISSKTEILNDELVKDEIVSVSSGNIQNFEVLSEVVIPDGGYATTVKATVSVNNLTSFVESKGVVVEFKGSILAANVKQQMLNEQNEIKSIADVVGSCKDILDLSCDFSMVRGTPIQKNDDNNIWAIPITINVELNENIEQFNKYLLSSIKGLAMSKDEILQYDELGKKTYKIALGASSVGGATKDLAYLSSLAANNTNLAYRIIKGPYVVFESNNLKEIKKEFKRSVKNAPYPEMRDLYEIQYYENEGNSVYHFRSMSSVVSLIDLVLYMKHSVLNFVVDNGIYELTAEKLVTDRNNSMSRHTRMNSKGYQFRIINDNLTPIFNARCDFSNFKYTSNGPNGLFGNYRGNGNTGCGPGPSSISLYEPLAIYSRNFYYNGGRNKSFGYLYNTKYGFLSNAEQDLPADIVGVNRESNHGFQAVISLYDFTVANNVITLLYEDILTLEEIAKVQEYKINPIR